MPKDIVLNAYYAPGYLYEPINRVNVATVYYKMIPIGDRRPSSCFGEYCRNDMFEEFIDMNFVDYSEEYYASLDRQLIFLDTADSLVNWDKLEFECYEEKDDVSEFIQKKLSSKNKIIIGEKLSSDIACRGTFDSINSISKVQDTPPILKSMWAWDISSLKVGVLDAGDLVAGELEVLEYGNNLSEEDSCCQEGTCNCLDDIK